jgi:hypothetical protein
VVAFSVDLSSTSVCAVSGSVVSFIGVGTCTIDANQAGNADYEPAPQVEQSFSVGPISQVITFTSTPPSTATVGGMSYVVSAIGGASGNPVTFTVAATAKSVCGISNLVLTFIGVGTCTIDANQAGTAIYGPAPQVQQSFSVGRGTPSTPTITNVPVSPVYEGSFVPVVGTTGDGKRSVTASTTSVCSVSSGTVSFVGVGTCTLTAHVAAGTNYIAGKGSPQTFMVSPATMAITSPNSATATAGTPFSFTVTTIGVPVPTITKKGKVPKHLALANQRNGTAIIAGIPKKAGIYHFIIKATFGEGPSGELATQRFTLTVGRA